MVFLDLRGFSAFAEGAEPEEVMDLLKEYHAEMGTLIFQFEGTLERFTGDGIMVFFNDPLPQEDHVERAVRMAVAMRDRGKGLEIGWAKRGYDLALGLGIANGYATLGSIGFAGRMDYAAIGTVTNLTARLCGEAQGGQILINQRAMSQVEHMTEAEFIGHLQLKGFSRPIGVFNILGVKGGGT